MMICSAEWVWTTRQNTEGEGNKSGKGISYAAQIMQRENK
jgi:hypothetical protein